MAVIDPLMKRRYVAPRPVSTTRGTVPQKAGVAPVGGQPVYDPFKAQANVPNTAGNIPQATLPGNVDSTQASINAHQGVIQTTDPMQSKINAHKGIIQGSVTDPFQTTTAQQTGALQPGTQQQQAGGGMGTSALFKNTAPGIGEGYVNTLQGALTGSLYDPFAQATKEAQTRAAMQQRSLAANKIAGAGFTGQGIADQLAGATEDEIRRNRFDTNLSIEQAKNQMKMNALGEAYQYGTAETGIEQWQKNFDEQKKQYGDTQAWAAYEQALQYGSPDDVGKAYTTATGKTLDPMAIQQQMDFAKKAKELGIKGQEMDLKTAEVALNTATTGQAGKDFASYLQTHLDLNPSDPAFTQVAQKLWESYGQTGPVPAGWAETQAKAVNDPKLTNAIVAGNYEIDQAVAAGAMSATDGQLLKDFNSQGFAQYLVRDPKTGKVSIDWEALNKGMNPTGTGTKGGTPGTPGTPPANTKPGSTYIQDGKIYQALTPTTGEEIIFDPDDPWADENNKILAAGETNNPYYATIMEKRTNEINKGLNGTYNLSNTKLKELDYKDPLVQKYKKERDDKIINYLKTNQPDLYQKLKTGGSTSDISKDVRWAIGYNPNENPMVPLIETPGGGWKYGYETEDVANYIVNLVKTSG